MTETLALSVVVPCYNEEAVLPELHRRLVAVCEKAVGSAFEILLIDDGSTDRTRDIIEQMHAEDARVVAVILSRNHGHQLALSAGLSETRGARILIIDADLQDPPELLREMMQLMDAGYDVVYGQRRWREGETAFKRASARLFYRMFRRLADLDLPLDAGDFRLISRKVRDVLVRMPEQDRFIRGMVSWVGFRQTPIVYDRACRFAGETKYPLIRMVRFALDAITGYTIIPLRIATWLGLTFAGVSALLSVYALVGWLRGATVEGWTSIMLLLLMLGGVQLFVTGILGEYLGRLYIQNKGRPLFVIDEVLRREPEVTRVRSLADG